MIIDLHNCVSAHPEQCRCGDCLTTMAGDVYAPEPEPTRINYPAVRAFNRVWNPIAHDLGMIEEADRGFDGGEFSGSFHNDQWSREYARVLALVGSRFDVKADALDEMVMDADWIENEKWVESYLGEIMKLRRH